MSNTRAKKYYRNKVEITANGEIVDPGSLWKMQHANTLVLVDDDRFVSHALTHEFE